jgi:hypothetical protein
MSDQNTTENVDKKVQPREMFISALKGIKTKTDLEALIEVIRDEGLLVAENCRYKLQRTSPLSKARVIGWILKPEALEPSEHEAEDQPELAKEDARHKETQNQAASAL